MDKSGVQKEAEDCWRKAYQIQMQAHQAQSEGREEEALIYFEEAIKYYEQSIDFYPTGEAHTFLGWNYSFMGSLHEAIGECKKAIEVDPDFGNPYNDIGAYLIELGRFDEAVPYLKKAMVARRYECYHYPHFNLARILELQGAWLEAIEEYKKAYEEALTANYDYPEAKWAILRVKSLMN